MATGIPGPVIPDRYVQALGAKDPLKSMRKAPKRIKKLVKGLSEKQLSRRAEPGKWSIKQVLAHLADGEVMIGSRFRLVAAMDRPALLGYDQDAFVERLGIEQARAKHLLEDFSAVRTANLRLLRRLPREVFGRIGLHSERGEESLEAMLLLYAGHDRIHEEQIVRLRGKLDGAREERKAAKVKAPKERRGKRKERGKLRPSKKAARKEAGARGRAAETPGPSPEPVLVASSNGPELGS